MVEAGSGKAGAGTITTRLTSRSGEFVRQRVIDFWGQGAMALTEVARVLLHGVR
jgi:hypothetical protein